MGNLLLSLPPLSPDYSGVASVLHDVGALTVIHDASGCTGTYTGYDEPRWFGSRSPVFCSGLREMDTVMGDDGKLLSKIRSALAHTPVPLVAVIGSPVPMVIGFDFRGFAALVERETGVPTIGFPVNGLSLYDRGQREAYLALAGRFLADVRPLARGVNLLGASALDGFDEAAVDALEGMLSARGMRLVSVWGTRSPLAELRRAGAARANWVLSAAALPLARFLREKYGTPYVAGVPVGPGEQERLLAGLDALLGGDKAEEPLPPAPAQLSRARALIVGEPLLGASLRAALGPPGENSGIALASFFEADEDLSDQECIRLWTEDDATRALSAAGLELVVADPLVRRLLPERHGVRFQPLAHAAVSGRLYRDSRSRLFGTAGESIFLSFGGLDHAVT